MKQYDRRIFSVTAMTVTELLVVLAVIAVLCVLIFPAINTLTSRSRQVICIGKMRTLGNAILLYQAENQQLPPNKTDAPGITTENCWTQVIAPYLGVTGTAGNDIGRKMQQHLSCPEAVALPAASWSWWYSDYGVNAAGDRTFGYDGEPHRPQITQPKDTMMLLETSNRTRAARPTANLFKNIEFRHGDKMNVLYFDGHIASIDADTLPQSALDVFWSGGK